VSVPNVTVSFEPLVKSVLILDVLTEDNLPSSNTVITGIAVELPYDAAVTPVADKPSPVIVLPSAAAKLVPVNVGVVVFKAKDCT